MTGKMWAEMESPVVIRLSPKEECIFFENTCIKEQNNALKKLGR